MEIVEIEIKEKTQKYFFGGGSPIAMKAHKQLLEVSRPYERLMVFIDGGYLREVCKKFHKSDNIEFAKLSFTFIRMFNTIGEPINPFRANLIRIYYYDAIVDENHPKYKQQREYFNLIDDQYAYTVRLGRLVESSKRGFKQKGVDLLMAIDAITKAYRNQYDTGMFFMGDADFIPLIEAVKNAGKKTIIVCHHSDVKKKLYQTFDNRLSFDEKALKSWLKSEKN